MQPPSLPPSLGREGGREAGRQAGRQAGREGCLFLPYALSLPNMRCTLPLFPPIHGDCLTTAEVSARGLSQPRFGQQKTPDVIITLVSYFWSPQVFPERSVNIKRYRQSNSPQSHNLPKQCDGTLC